MAAEVGSIYIGLTADLSSVVADFERTAKVVDRFGQGATRSASITAIAFDNMQARFLRLSSQLGLLGSVMRGFGPTGLVLAGTLGGAALAFDLLVNRAQEFARKLGDLKDAAKTIGLTTDQLQSLRGAGKEFGATGDEIAASIGRFSIEMDQLRQGSGELLQQIRRIDPALADQLAGTKDNVTALDLYARAWSQAAEAQKNALAKAGFGKSGLNVGQVLGVVNDAGGLDALASKARQTGGIIQSDIIDRLDDLQKQLERTRNATGKNFNLLFSENALKHDLEVAQDLEKISEILRDFKPSTAWQRFLDWITTPTDAAQAARARVEDTIRYSRQVPVGGIIGNEPAPQPHRDATALDTGSLPTSNVPLPPARPAIPTPALSPTAEYQYRQYQQLIAVLGQAITPSERLKLKQLELAAAIERGGVSSEIASRAMAAYRLSIDQQNVALRERLGVATQEERMAIKERELDQLVRSGTISVHDRAQALEIYRRELAEVVKYEPLRLSDTPNLTRLSIEARDLKASLDQQLTNALQNIPAELISIADGSEKASDGLKNLTLAMLRAIAQAVLMKSVVSPLAMTISSLFGVSGGGAVQPAGGTSVAAVTQHTGGTWGDAFPRRLMPLPRAAWGPRLHSGLSSNEYRAVLDKSEHVLTSPTIRRTANALGGLAAAAVNSSGGGNVEINRRPAGRQPYRKQRWPRRPPHGHHLRAPTRRQDGCHCR